MADLDWVRITILDASGVPVAEWDLVDPWYRLGGHRHPDLEQDARDELASTELHEWLTRTEPAAGSYVLWAAALDRVSNVRGVTWASVRATYPAAQMGVAS